jgi:bifunctional UDP-N-acetylglucosamine pyrophosphorylase/glucosamine-1-phosphate N-acetyltransferase
MSLRSFAVVVLAAGSGTRMKSDRPKVLHPVAGRSMLAHVLGHVAELAPERIVVVVGAGMEAVAEAAAPYATVVQDPPLGTGHAVLQAADALAGYHGPDGGGDLLVVYGDTPLLRPRTLARLLEERRRRDAPSLVGLAFRPSDPGHYGRVVLDEAGRVARIVEYVDAGEDERRIALCNGGVLLGDAPRLFRLLEACRRDNAKGEVYLTDVFALAYEEGLDGRMIETETEEILGVNSRADLAVVEAVLQTRLRGAAMAQGATLVDPSTVWFSADTRLGRDVTIEPNVFLGPGVVLGDGVEVRAFSHIEGARIEAGARIGPFARLRPGTVVGPGARIGNFVEVKNATLGAGAKANHLAYVGDAEVGEGANVGAGTITCNYDGFAKHRTRIGAGAFIGSNTALVAPVTVGPGAIIGAGSTITEDVAPDALALSRAPQSELEGAAERLRQSRATPGKAPSAKPGKA